MMGTLLFQAVPASSKRSPCLGTTCNKVAIDGTLCGIVVGSCGMKAPFVSSRGALEENPAETRAVKCSTRGGHALYAWPSPSDLLPIVPDQMLRSTSTCVHGHNYKFLAVTWMHFGPTRLPLALARNIPYNF